MPRYNTVEQAMERADGTNSRKGIEVAHALGRMMEYAQSLR